MVAFVYFIVVVFVVFAVPVPAPVTATVVVRVAVVIMCLSTFARLSVVGCRVRTQSIAIESRATVMLVHSRRFAFHHTLSKLVQRHQDRATDIVDACSLRGIELT